MNTEQIVRAYTCVAYTSLVPRLSINPFHYQSVVILQPGPSMSVLDSADARPNDIHGLLVGGRDVRNTSNSFALRWCFFFALKWKS